MKYQIITLGCKVNSYESQAMKEMLDQHGCIESEKDLDLVIINTCAVTHVGEHKSRQKVSSYAKKYPEAIIVVCGCSAQLHPQKMEDIEGVDIVFGNNNHEKLLEYIQDYQQNKQQVVHVEKNTRNRKYQDLKITCFDEKMRAFIKIGDGCNNFCSYCIIPYSRGNLRSRDAQSILNEVQELIKNHYQEIVITGIDSASYGVDKNNGYYFNDLLYDIVKIPNLNRIRISSVEASQLDDRFIQLLKEYPSILPHLHIPLQSGSDTVLKRMHRKYTCDEFYNKIARIHQEIPLVALACDVIVGFPGETEEEFIETMKFIEKCQFAFLHVFPYSIREGTVAAMNKNQVPESIKKERVHRLITLGDQLTEQYKNQMIGKKMSVLIETYDEKRDCYHGLSEYYLDVYVKSKENLIGRIITITYRKDEILKEYD